MFETTRNAQWPGSDDTDEMTTRPRLDDRTADALFSGRLPADREDLADVAAFAETLRAAASAAPTPVPGTALAALLADGLTIDMGARSTTGRRRAAAPTAPVTRPHARTRKKRMLLETLFAKLAGLGLLAKTGVAAAAVTASATGVGLTGNLPPQAQAPFNRVLGIEEPAEDDEATEEQVEADAEDDALDTGATDTSAPGDAIDDAAADDDAADDPVDDEDGADDTEATDPEDGTDEQEPAQDAPGAEGRANAAENAGENGAHGRAIAEEAATSGREFGQKRAAEAKERRATDEEADEGTDEETDDPADDGTSTEEPQADRRSNTGAEASQKGRDRAAQARGKGDTSDTEEPATDADEADAAPGRP